ncbi:MAG TPA: right-handed parallel beta-helix repeat-containing protein, partial [Segetibacter sp.]
MKNIFTFSLYIFPESFEGHSAANATDIFKWKKPLLICIFLGLNLFVYTKASSQIVYIDSAAVGLNNGTSWKDAFRSLDSVCIIPDSLWRYDSVLIAKGTYKPAIKPRKSVSTDLRDVTFHLPSFTSIYGGYPTGGGLRDAKNNRVILSGDIGATGNDADNAYHVVLIENANIEIDGLIIEKGNANGLDSLLVDNRKISRSSGGGGHFTASDLLFENCIVRNNTSVTGGGLFISENSQFTFYNSIVENNTATRSGGGIYFDNGSSTRISNSIITGNSAAINGGGIYCKVLYETSVRNCTFFKNKSNGRGSGFFNAASATTEIANTIFSDNYKFSPSLSNVGGADIEDSISISDVRFCILQTYKGTEGNTAAFDAFFQQKTNPAGADNTWGTVDDGLRITAHSAAFNTGSNSFDPNVATDITGLPRIQNSIIDIGAYEINPCSVLSGRIAYVDSSAKGTGTGDSWINAFQDLQSAINLKRAGCVDTIKVARGSYFPDSYPNGVTGSFTRAFATFTLPDSIVIIGGYSSGGSAAADPDLNAVFLKGEYKSGITTFNNSHVIICAGVENVKLLGITISSGIANGFDSILVNNIKVPRHKGGGIIILNSSVELVSCRLTKNQAVDGGAISAYRSRMIVKSCRLFKNTATNGNAFNGGGGGAIHLQELNVGSFLSSCSIDSNSSPMYGGAIYNYYSDSLKIDSCSFTGNKTIQTGGNVIGGGAIYNYYAKGSLYNNVLFKGNSGYNGGALSDYGAYTQAVNCRFIDNSALREGGAVYLNGNTNLYNCLFYGNSTTEAGRGGGAISTYAGRGVIGNCTFIANRSNGEAGAVYSDGLAINNSLFWYNLRNNDSTLAGADLSGSGIFTRNLLQVTEKTDNITGHNPLFKNYADPDGPDNIWGTLDDGIIPSIFSPVINMGDNTSVDPRVLVDITGVPRIQARFV